MGFPNLDKLFPPRDAKEEGRKKKLTIKEIGIDKLLIILLAGVALVILSIPEKSGKEKNTEPAGQVNTITVSEDTYEKLLEERLMEILSCVEGVGRTKVMITMKSTEEKIVLKESPYSKSNTTEIDSEGGSRDVTEFSQSEAVVYIEEGNGKKTPYVIKEMEPQIEGVVVIAEGGDSIYTIKDIIDAVSALFDIPSHKIKVMKMKSS